MSSRVLIIDSDIDFGEQVHHALIRLGVEAETVADGDEGARLVLMERPDLVILGLLDTKGAGYGLCSKLKRKASEISVVMVVDAGEQGLERLDRHRALKGRSADAYVTRPFTLQRLTDVLNGLLSEMVEAPEDAMDRVIGDARRAGGDSLLSGGLFDPDEIAEIEAEADHAFDSLVTDGAAPGAGDPAPAGQSYDDEGTIVAPVDAMDLLGPGDEEPTRVAATPDMVPAPAAPRDEEVPVESLGSSIDAAAVDASDEAPPAPEATSDPTSEAELEAELAAEVEAELLMNAGDLEIIEQSAPDLAEAREMDGFETAEAQAREAAQSDRENRKLRARLIELQQELKLVSEDLARREAEHAAHRQSDSTAKRELIEVREDLNRREREVLEMRDRLTSKDRQMVDLTDEIDQHKRDKEKLEQALRAAEARVGAGEGARDEAEQEIESLRVRLSETRVRLENAKQEADKTYAEIKALQKKATDDLAEANRAHAKAIAAAEGRTEAAQTELAREKREAQAAIEAAQSERDQKIAELETAHTEALDALRGQHRDEVEALREEHGDSLATVRKGHEEEVERLEGEKATAAKAHKEAVTALKGEHAAQVERATTEWQGRVDALQENLDAQTRRAEGAEAEGERLDGELKAANELLDQEAERAEAAEKRLTGELEAEKKARADDVAERDARIADLDGTLSVRDEKIAELERAVEGLATDVTDRDATIAARDKANTSLAAARDALSDRVAALNGELGEARALASKVRTAMAVGQAYLEHITGPDDEIDEERAPEP